MILIGLLKKSVHKVLIFLSVLKCILTIDTFSAETWQELDSLAIKSVQVDVVDLTLKTFIADGEVDIVNVSALLVLVLFLQ